MFGKMKKMFSKQNDPEELKAALVGKMVTMQEVPDPTFAEEMLGPGVAIIPSEGKLYAPVKGEVTLVFDTLHAVAITTEAGAELIFHIGLDTVQEEGVGFTSHVTVGDKVEAGDLLISFDLTALEEKGYNMITPIIVTNKDLFSAIEINQDKLDQDVNTEDIVLTLTKA
ncbi:MAG: PTS glucose transporter subunit IIA [Clostridiaceae bacterium]|jgi:PTS system beta-glucosides-specific IIC component|nr:PTS glucose transporter subunit IIA [Bacillota bacterium]NLN51745.1 PTS glucose transporter subunit IIA [Clostridiaceae bacterium]